MNWIEGATCMSYNCLGPNLVPSLEPQLQTHIQECFRQYCLLYLFNVLLGMQWDSSGIMCLMWSVDTVPTLQELDYLWEMAVYTQYMAFNLS